MTAPPPAPAGSAREFRRLIRRLASSRLVYGRPVQAGERTVIPVARVRLAGGFGFGRPGEGEGPATEGGGGGGLVDARPVGFIEVGPEGARYQRIAGRRGAALVGAILAGALAGTAVSATAVGGRALTRLARAALPSTGKLARGGPAAALLPWPRRSRRR